ncbi:fused MFS/spermidine synthase [Gloeocapsa sp. PCC 73106]|uniref:fused MFS/spermidine synthase n=1 Tax=Gloeocapsa sp. PCC 73106 TaxID=102232 RepID=UPI0002ACC043|nr:fused MFS/spermidine synthase [Gloeocapsa sp. PCC 73106]ELR96668.1 hypothetical protein GLO73106DRAFT_00004640 [Gloeocapsa sp. PCC 73106]
MFPLLVLYFISGFTALLYQVVWQRMLGLFSGSDVRSVTIVIASYLLGLGLGSLIGGFWSDHQGWRARRDRINQRRAIQIYGFCNLGIAIFAIFSRFLFYDLLFLHLKSLAQSTPLTLLVVFLSLLIPTVLMGLSLPLLSRAIARHADRAAHRIGLLYGINTLDSGLGALITGWYILGTVGYEGTIALGAILSILVGCIALLFPRQFNKESRVLDSSKAIHSPPGISPLVLEWCFFVFLSGFSAISLEIIWFRILDTILQSISYTYAHLLAFIELLGAELEVLQEYAKTPVGRSLSFLFNDRRYEFIIGDGRQELALADQQFDIIEADAIYP